MLRIGQSVDLNQIGKFPQLGEMLVGLHMDDPRHLFNNRGMIPIPADTYIPSFKLRKGTKLTDVLSTPINNDWVVSEKLKDVFEKEKITDVQFVPINIYKSPTQYATYYLLRCLRSRLEFINYKKTEISIMETTWDELKRVKVSDVDEFLKLVEQTKLPFSIKIQRPFLHEDCSCDFFVLTYVYSRFELFVSESFKEVLNKKGCTGIRFMDLDEV
jgi:hypothetical protein